jgi:hypothetical protein
LLRLAWTVARESDAPVFYLDGKGDRETAARFCGLMDNAGRQARVFPNEPFDSWRGQAHEIHGRLMEIIDYTSDGPAAWYRDVAKNVLRLVCEHPDGPPRSSGQVLARMDADALAKAHQGSSALAALTAQQIKQVRLRYEAFFGPNPQQPRWQLDLGGHQRRLSPSRQSHPPRRDGGGRADDLRGLRALLHDPQAPRPVRAADRR